MAIENAQANSQVQASLTEFGYTPERIQEGKTLYEQALAAQQTQQAEYGEQIGASATFEDAWSKAKKSYMRLLKIARVAFKGDAGMATKLALNGRRKQSLSGWLLQAKQFYTNALGNSEAMNALGKYGITSGKLEAAQAETQAVEAADLVQEKEKGEAQSATKMRDEALDALDEWLDDFVAIARVALEDEPQLLETMGILERS